MCRESTTLHNFQVKGIPHTGLKIRQSPARIIFREKSLIPVRSGAMEVLYCTTVLVTHSPRSHLLQLEQNHEDTNAVGFSIALTESIGDDGVVVAAYRSLQSLHDVAAARFRLSVSSLDRSS